MSAGYNRAASSRDHNGPSPRIRGAGSAASSPPPATMPPPAASSRPIESTDKKRLASSHPPKSRQSDLKNTRLNSSHLCESRMPSSARKKKNTKYNKRTTDQHH